MTLQKIREGELHPRNKHKGRYDMPKLMEVYKPLQKFVSENKYGDLSIDFFNSEAVICLNKALLAHYYNVKNWDLPKETLTPPIPGRADYIHHISDLVGTHSVRCFDIGVGASCIYPIIGVSEYGWDFLGSDISIDSLKNAQKIVENNPILHNKVELVHQKNKNSIFKGVIFPNERFDVCICNPPFHSSQEAAEKGTLRKLKNLKGKPITKTQLNFKGKSNELWYEGGELKFISNMISESALFKGNFRWFTTLVSKEDNLNTLIRKTQQVNSREHVVINMYQGNKRSRILAWRY